MKQYIAFAGSRTAQNHEAIQQIVMQVAAGAVQFYVGDAVGADAIVLDQLLHTNCSRLTNIYSAADVNGQGTWHNTAVTVVANLFRDGANVVPQDDATKPLTKRLASRTAKMVYAAAKHGKDAALVCFFDHANSRGTEWAATCAQQAHIEIIAYGDPANFPQLGAGSWQPAISRQFKGGHIWISAARAMYLAQQEKKMHERRAQYGVQLQFAM